MTLEQHTKKAIQRMIEDAEKKGANAVVSMRFGTSMIMSNTAEVLSLWDGGGAGIDEGLNSILPTKEKPFHTSYAHQLTLCLFVILQG